VQESRIQEIRDTHRLEGSSQSDLISKLRQQLATAETSLAQKTTDGGNLSQMKDDLNKAQTQAKEEEEKRSKAISLLKTVRMKLVKAEKEKEEVEKDRAEERAERSSARDEVERVKAEKEREVNSLRKGFERETQGIKERAEKELAAKKAAWELEMITTKVSFPPYSHGGTLTPGLPRQGAVREDHESCGTRAHRQRAQSHKPGAIRRLAIEDGRGRVGPERAGDVAQQDEGARVPSTRSHGPMCDSGGFFCATISISHQQP